MRVKYIRNHVFSVRPTENGPELHMRREPVACIVQDEHGNIGVSVCHTDANIEVSVADSYTQVDVLPGDNFSKAKAKQIALGRAMVGSEFKVPNRKITNVFGQRVSLAKEVKFWVDKFNEVEQVSV